jgi:hypothetical protein
VILDRQFHAPATWIVGMGLFAPTQSACHCDSD